MIGKIRFEFRKIFEKFQISRFMTLTGKSDVIGKIRFNFQKYLKRFSSADL